MTLKNNMQMNLKPVLALHGYASTFDGEEGAYTCELRVQSGTVEFIHGAYNVETGIWDMAPGTEPERIVVHENEVKRINFVCGKHYGQKDSILISNHSYLKPAVFTCSYEQKEGLREEGAEPNRSERETKKAA